MSSETDEKLRSAIDSLVVNFTTIKDDHEKRITYQETCRETAEKNLDTKIKKYMLAFGAIALVIPLLAIAVTIILAK